MTKINTILFDLGGVILNLDQIKTLHAFKKLGADLDQINLESTLFTDYETGKLSSDEFRKKVMSYIQAPTHESLIDDAWNAMLLDLPIERINVIETVKKSFRVGLVSNTNEIHIRYFRKYLSDSGLLERWDNLFDHQILSYEIGHRKPDLSYYEFAVNRFETTPQQCIFIDDNHSNIKEASAFGMHTIHALQPIGTHTLEELRNYVTT